MDECCVCYETKALFKIECNHPICYNCVRKLTQHVCPLCRCVMRRKHTTPRVRVPNEFEKQKLELFGVLNRIN
jgi:hypothetical protein